ncbi:MAG: type II and III secretion system protein family protein [Planctomycetota bacterium]
MFITQCGPKGVGGMEKQAWSRALGRLTLAAALCTVLICSAPQLPAQTNGGGNGTLQVGEAETKPIQVKVDQSLHLRTPWPVKRVSVTNPEVADVNVLNPNQLLVMGKRAGTTDVLMWSESEDAMQLRVEVDLSLEEIENRTRDLFPSSDLQFTGSGNTVLVRGQLSRTRDAAKLREYLETAGVAHVDMTEVAGPQQVLLKVRVAEVSRTALREMSVNLFQTGKHAFGGSQIGSSGGPFNPVSIGPAEGSVVTESVPFVFTSDVEVSSGATLFLGFPRSETELFFRALRENQYMRLLAEPNLVTRSGERASFLAGGEFPIPVVQNVGSDAGGTAITIEWKEFGVRLNFRPVVLGEGTIRLEVLPEVSTLSSSGAVTIGGFTIPSLVVRRAEATLELQNGETFAMAGLINDTIATTNSSVPGLGQLPVLGPFFRSVRYKQDQTELIVLVTASLVEPMSAGADLPLPGELHTAPNDWELYLGGQIEGREQPRLSKTAAEQLQEMGLDRIVGPGAWETHEERGARSRASTVSRDGEDQ